MPALVLLSLHVGVFLLIAAVLLPTDAEVFIAVPGLKAELFLFLFAVLYLFLALVSVVPSYRWKFGLALSAVAVPFFVLLLAGFRANDVSLPRSGWFLVLSLMDSLAFVLLLFFLRRITRAPPAPEESTGHLSTPHERPR